MSIFASVSNLTARIGRNACLPPSEQELSRLIVEIPDLPSDLVELYSLIGGTQQTSDTNIYLMSPHRVIECIAMFRELKHVQLFEGDSEYGDGKTGLLLFADSCGDHLGLYLRQPFAPRGFLYQHDDFAINPSFRSLSRMIDAIALTHPDADCIDVKADYPFISSENTSPIDSQLSFHLLQQYYSDPSAKGELAIQAMNLVHPKDAEVIVKLLESPIPFVVARACSLVRFHRCTPAIKLILTAAIRFRNDNDVVIGAIVALRDWEIPEAQDALEIMKKEFRDFEGYFPKNTAP